MLRVGLLAFVAGTAAVHGAPGVPSWPVSVLLLVGGLLAAAGLRRSLPYAALPLACALLGLASSAVRADLRLADALALPLENKPLQLTFQVAGLPGGDARFQRFEAVVREAPPGVPSRVLLSWYARGAERLSFVPGQVWRAQAALKQPHGNLNPHGFDYEALLFERGVRATGSLRGAPRLVGDEPLADFAIAVQRVRHGLRAALRQPLAEARYGPVIVALAMGDQAGVDAGDWDVFNRVGITHLVSISGMHVTLFAALAGAAALAGWKRWSWRGLALPERTPAQVVGAAVALVVAWLYCLVAGWGVPAQRTFFMLAVVAGAAVARLPWSGSRILLAAGALVCALDPWAPLAAGFWLSFGAVGLLITLGTGRWRRPGTSRELAPRRWLRALGQASRVQLAMTVGMLPLSAWLFQQVSLVSPLANALAIPLVGLLVTPLSLAALLACAIPGLAPLGGLLAWAAHAVFDMLMQPMQALAALPQAAYAVAAPPWPWVVAGIAGTVWALQPRGLPGRRMALLLLLPALCWRPARPESGDWRLAALDVGQGAAIAVETASGVLLYDTGPKFGTADAGSRVVWPYLRARGVRSLRMLMVSHADTDHAGGLASVLAALPVAEAMASYDLGSTARAPVRFRRCRAGQSWNIDGVRFSVLFPDAAAAVSRDRNAASCVLKIEGRHHSALLTGDLAFAEERRLLKQGGLAADVVLMPHHGSRTGSGRAFAEAVGARHAIAQAGYLNRYGHPHPDALKRWLESAAVVHRTDRHGAVVAESRGGGLLVKRERERRARMWHAR